MQVGSFNVVYMRHLKAKIISYLKLHPDANFNALLRDTVKSYNESYSKVLKGSPSSLNSNFFDLVLRERLYGHHPRLLPFEDWYKNQLKFQKKSLKHRKGLPRNNNDFFVNDLGIQKLGSCKFIEYDKFLKKSS